VVDQFALGVHQDDFGLTDPQLLQFVLGILGDGGPSRVS
jgi:hypothetical protein